MSYSALYRVYRPTKFDEVVGQDVIIKTLKNQLISNKVGHAYLFNGTRGTGKTSIAKIFSRAINCLNPQDGEPCNECDICKQALNGSLPDIVELDAASNNSVENIRQIIDEVNFLPTQAKYRVYIIDEVHMLSIGAFNALLKTLEEPPEHVKFILATTEPHKIPATILSRCQRYDFKKIGIDDIVKRLKIVCDSQKISYSEESLRLIATLSDGALRDGLSILDRVVQSGTNIEDVNNLRDLVGIPSSILVGNLTKAILESDIDNILKISNKMVENVNDPQKVITEIIKYIRDILLYQVEGKLDIYNSEELEQIKELAKYQKEKLVSLIYELSELENKVKQSTQKTIVFQSGLLTALQEKHTGSTSNLEARINKIENYLNSRHVQNVQSRVVQTNINIPQPAQAKPKNVENFWKETIARLKKEGKMVLAANLANTNGKLINDTTVGIYFMGTANSFAREVLQKPENVALLQNILYQILGKKVTYKIFETQTTTNITPLQEFENLVKDNDIDLKVEE